MSERGMHATSLNWRPTPVERDALPAEPGAYILEFDLHGPVRVCAGGRDELDLSAGVVRYYGSARGPGGLGARVARHLRSRDSQPHWHVDYLTERIEVDRIGLHPGGDECGLCRADRERAARVEVPSDGFGASDCSECPAHLLWFPDRSSVGLSDD